MLKPLHHHYPSAMAVPLLKWNYTSTWPLFVLFNLPYPPLSYFHSSCFTRAMKWIYSFIFIHSPFKLSFQGIGNYWRSVYHSWSQDGICKSLTAVNCWTEAVKRWRTYSQSQGLLESRESRLSKVDKISIPTWLLGPKDSKALDENGVCNKFGCACFYYVWSWLQLLRLHRMTIYWNGMRQLYLWLSRPNQHIDRLAKYERLFGCLPSHFLYYYCSFYKYAVCVPRRMCWNCWRSLRVSCTASILRSCSFRPGDMRQCWR